MADMASEYLPLYRLFQILPKNEELYALAFTHSSYNGMAGTIIRTSAEAAYCRKLGLNQYIRVGASFAKDASANESLLEDVFESFVGALFLDQGLDKTYQIVRSIFEEDVKSAKVDLSVNPKSYLQECMQADKKESVTYRIIEERGSGGDKVFVAAVYFEGAEIGRGSGKNKKAAETEAASDALRKMSLPE